MKRVSILFVLSLFLSDLAGPPSRSMVIIQSNPINPYESIIRAVVKVESSDGRDLLNEKENAVGWFGIRSIRLKDYNERTGESITHQQCYQYETGRKIFLYYASQYRPDDILGICREWNGKSEKNLYYKKIKETWEK